MMVSHVTPDTAMMDRPVTRMMSVPVMKTLVTSPSPHVSILTVHTNVHVTKDIKKTVWNVNDCSLVKFNLTFGTFNIRSDFFSASY